jgi:hypothetical protein
VRALSLAPALAAALAVLAVGCGLNVASPDLFVLTRTGAGPRLSLLVSDGGTIRCNGGPDKPLADRLLIQARDLASRLNDDAKHGLHIQRSARSVAMYRVRLQHGTISFPDTAAGTHHDLAQLELFAVQAGQGACGLRS